VTERRRATEDRQVELTDAALRIIATQGIAALTTRRLAAEVGLTTGAIFRHFASLDALLDAVVARVEAVLAATFPPATLPPLAQLEQFITARSTAVGSQLGILRLVLSEQFLLALPERSSKRLAACVQRTRAFVIATVRSGQADGTIRVDVAAEVLAPIIMGTIQMLALRRGPLADASQIRAGLLTLVQPLPAAPSASRKRSS
jgi:AcrR family transcriptional regulator